MAASLLLQMNRDEEAAVIYRNLIIRNPDNWANYKHLEMATHPSKF